MLNVERTDLACTEKQERQTNQLSSAISKINWKSNGRPHEYEGDLAICSNRRK